MFLGREKESPMLATGSKLIMPPHITKAGGRRGSQSSYGFPPLSSPTLWPEFGRRLVVSSTCSEQVDKLSLLFEQCPTVTAPAQMLFEPFASLELVVQIGI